MRFGSVKGWNNVEELSAEIIDLLETLLDAPLVDIEELNDSLTEYQEELREHIAHSEFLDEELAETLYARCMEMLERVANDYSKDSHKWAQAAAMYFMEQEDEEIDLESPVGFDDDRDVFNVIAQELDFDDLIIGY